MYDGGGDEETAREEEEEKEAAAAAAAGWRQKTRTPHRDVGKKTAKISPNLSASAGIMVVRRCAICGGLASHKRAVLTGKQRLGGKW